MNEFMLECSAKWYVMELRDTDCHPHLRVST